MLSEEVTLAAEGKAKAVESKLLRTRIEDSIVVARLTFDCTFDCNLITILGS